MLLFATPVLCYNVIMAKVLVIIFILQYLGSNMGMEELEQDRLCFVQDKSMLSKILQTVSWKSVAIIYSIENFFDLLHIFDTLDEMNNGLKLWTYDMTNKSREYMKDVLLMLHRSEVDGFLLLLNNNTYRFVELANVLDYESNRTTNFRTNSKWIIIDQFYFTSLVQSLELKHVIILRCAAGILEASTVMGDRCVDYISCLKYDTKCSMDGLFPNIKYKFNGRHLIIGTVYVDHMISKIYDDINNKTIDTGILAELTAVIAQQLNFTYTFVESQDRQYGAYVNGTWNGLTGQLYNQHIDLVVADLTISSERLEVIDFILPVYLNQNLGVMYRNDIAEDSNWIKVFRPLSSNVYICFLVSVLGVGILLYLIDVDFDHNSLFHTTRKRTLFKFFSSLLSVFGFVSLSGNGLWPQKSSARILVAYFWIFTVILTATYVGNLTAKLTETINKRPFSSLEELVNLEGWKWGIMGEGLVNGIMKDSPNGILKQLYDKMLEFNRTDPDIFVWDLNKQMDKVLNSGEKYALFILGAKSFMLNSTHCNFAILDNVISSLGLALGVSKNSYLKYNLEQTMWALSNNGILQLLQDQFYVDKRPAGCKASKTKRPMYIADMLGLVLVFGFGIGLSVVILFVEMHLNEFRRRDLRKCLSGKK